MMKLIKLREELNARDKHGEYFYWDELPVVIEKDGVLYNLEIVHGYKKIVLRATEENKTV